MIVRDEGRAVEIDESGLRVPHPRLAERDFVLAPLCDLDSEIEVAPGLTARAALARIPSAARTVLRARIESLGREVRGLETSSERPTASDALGPSSTNR